MPDTSKLEKLNRELEKSEKKLRKVLLKEQLSLSEMLKNLLFMLAAELSFQM